MSRIRILIYALDKYNLRARAVSFPDHGKLLKEVDSGYTCTFKLIPILKTFKWNIAHVQNMVWYTGLNAQFTGQKKKTSEK